MLESLSLNILADENMAAANELFSQFGKVTTKSGRQITNQDLKNTDILLVRSVTKVNQALLNNTPVKFVGSATIGIDHIDLNYLGRQHINFTNAPGCNAQGVAEYVIQSILMLNPTLLVSAQKFTLGIIGLGNIGRRLAKLAIKLGWEVIGYDPYITLPYVKPVTLAELGQQSNVISLHVPYTTTGDYPTHHLINGHLLSLMPSTTALINTSRGGVVDEMALLKNIKQTKRQYVADVFEQEPEMFKEHLAYFSLISPHIAGYTQEGKLRGSYHLYKQLAAYLGESAHVSWRQFMPEVKPLFNNDLSFKDNLNQHWQESSRLLEDDHNLRQIACTDQVKAIEFDRLRKNYPLRYEWQTLGLAEAEQV